jgi:glycosyltransferase involved in cell wall biosynthesis
MRLLVISSAIHYEWQGRVSSIGGYTREIDVWADLFSEVGIAAPLRREPPPGDCMPFTRQNITVVSQKEVGGASSQAKLKLLANVPGLLWNLTKAIRRYDAVHVRCPGNLGFLGILLAPLFSRRMVAKYAGQWNGYSGEDLSGRMQRHLLRSRYWRGPVTVYGRWPKQPAHVIPFFTSVMTREQLERAARGACRKREGSSLHVLFVGRLSAAKNVDTLIEALALLNVQGTLFSCSIIGQGPERERLEAMANKLELASVVRFTGGLAHDGVLELMGQSDVLVLASKSEGWPKAIAEGMAHGLICIGSDRGFVPEMLAEGRGLVLPARDARKLAETLGQIATDPQSFEPMRERAASWATKYSLEGLRAALAELLRASWKLPPDDLQYEISVTSEEVTP